MSTGQAALSAKLAAVIHEFCDDLPWKDSERIGAEAARSAWDADVTPGVRVFRYAEPNRPTYRAYPDGRITRNGEESDPGDLAYCEWQVSKGAMTEVVEVQP